MALRIDSYADVARAAGKEVAEVVVKRIAKLLMDKVRTEDSVATLQAAVNDAPDSADAHYWLGETLSVRIDEVSTFRKLGMAGDMREAFRRAVELAPGEPRYRVALFEYFRQAPSIAGGSLDKAREQLAALEKLDAGQAHEARGELFEQDKNLKDAETEYRAAVAAAPEEAEHRLRLGMFYETTERWDDAWKTFEQLLQRSPNELAAQYQLGKIAASTGQHLPRGEAALREYLNHPPLFQAPPPAWAHFRLGQVYERMQKPDDARSEYETALRLDPKHADAKKALDALGKN